MKFTWPPDRHVQGDSCHDFKGLIYRTNYIPIKYTKFTVLDFNILFTSGLKHLFDNKNSFTFIIFSVLIYFYTICPVKRPF